MVSIPKVVGVLSCGFLLCLGLSHSAQAENAASAADDMKAGQVDQKEMVFQMKSLRTIQGEVLRVEGANYLIQEQDGKEVSLQTDQTTLKAGKINPGDRIEAKVDENNYALSIHSTE